MVTSEPSGSMAWMPLNNHASVKPTYDIHSTVNYDPAVAPALNRVFIGNGRLRQHGRQPAGRELPDRRLAHVQLALGRADRSYLVENSVGHFDEQRAHGDRRRRPLLRVPERQHRRHPQGHQQGDHGPAGGHHPLPGAVQRAVPVQRQRHRRRAAERRPSRRRCRRRSSSSAARSATTRRPSATRTCTSGGATTSPTTSTAVHVLQGGLRDASSEYYFAGRQRRQGGGRRCGSAAYKAAFEATIVSRFNTQLPDHDQHDFWSVAPANPTSANLFAQPEHLHPAGHVATSPCGRSSARTTSTTPARRSRATTAAARSRRRRRSRSSRSGCRTSRSAA